MIFDKMVYGSSSMGPAVIEQPAKTGRQQDGRFAKGDSGNPNGRPAGSRHKATLAAEALHPHLDA